MDPRDLPLAVIVPVPQAMIDVLPPSRLGPAELVVIAYAYAHPAPRRAGRHASAPSCGGFGLTVAGTLGLLVRAKRTGLVPAVRPLMDALVVEGFCVTPGLYRVTLDLADEAP